MTRLCEVELCGSGLQLMAPKKVLPFLTERVTEELLIDLKERKGERERGREREGGRGGREREGRRGGTEGKKENSMTINKSTYLVMTGVLSILPP